MFRQRLDGLSHLLVCCSCRATLPSLTIAGFSSILTLPPNPKPKPKKKKPEGSMVTMDYRTDRVRVFIDVDDGNKVVRAPRKG